MSNIEEFLELVPFAKELNILFVEDNEEVQTQTKKMLDNIFNNIKVVSNGADALELYEQNRDYDIVITDISMPKMNGTALCSKILELDKEQLIIVISAYSNHEMIKQLLSMGVQKYIQKPIDNQGLIDSLVSILKVLKNRKENSD